MGFEVVLGLGIRVTLCSVHGEEWGRGRMSWLGVDRLGLGIRVGRGKKKKRKRTSYSCIPCVLGEAWRDELMGVDLLG